jgi:hypothetical protein
MSNALKISTVGSPAPPQAPPPPRGVQWITVQTAAQRSGLDESTLRKRCGNEWLARGFARLDGKAWVIREDADVRLSRVRFAENLPCDLKSLTDRNRKKVLAKAAILKSWETYLGAAVMRGQPAERATECFLEELAAGTLPDAKLPGTMKLPTGRTLYRWRAEYRKDGLGGLVDERATSQDKSGGGGDGGEDPFFEAVRFYLLDQRERTISVCWELACGRAEAEGFMPRSYKQTVRYVAKLPHRVMQRHRKGPKFANGNAEPFISRDYSTIRSNEVWCSDEHTFDVWVKHRGELVRPYLVGFEDMRSRKIVGWVISAKSADTNTVLTALHRGCTTHGLPEKIYVDNGRVFDNRALSGQTKQMRLGKMEVDKEVMGGVLAGLGIGITHAIAFNAKAKPIERFFGTVCGRFSKLQPTYCGKNPQSKPENLKSKLQRGQAPEFEDFVAAFELWLEGDYHARGHTGHAMDGNTPASVFTACLVEKRTAPAEVMDVMLWKPDRAKCGWHGVTCEGMDYGRGHPALNDWHGKDVLISIDPNDANRAAVREPSGRLICIATANQRLPFNTTKAELQEKKRAISRERKALHQGYAQRPRKSLDVADQIYQERAEKQRAAELAANVPPPVEKIIHTPISGQLEELRCGLDASKPRLKIAGDDSIEPAERLPSMRELMDSRIEELDAERERAEEARAEERRKHHEAFLEIFGGPIEAEAM